MIIPGPRGRPGSRNALPLAGGTLTGDVTTSTGTSVNTAVAAALAALPKAGGTMTGDITTSAALSLNAALAHYWRGLGPVTRTYTAAGLGAANPTRRLPAWGGVTYDGTTQTNARAGGIYTPVNQAAATFGARHRMLVVVGGLATAQQCGPSVSLSGGADIYYWGLIGGQWYQWHEVATVPTAAAKGLQQIQMAGSCIVELYIPERATEATAVNVTLRTSPDGETWTTIDTVSLAPTGTGLGGGSAYHTATIIAESWSAT